MAEIDVADVVVKNIVDKVPIYIKDVIADWQFFALLMATIAFVYLKPQIFYTYDFYSNCFRNKKGCCNTKSFISPPRPWVYRLLSWLLDAFQVIAIITYIYNQRFPTPGTGEVDYFDGIIAVFITIIILKYIYLELFFNYHQHLAPLGLAMVGSFLIWVANLVLVILFGLRATGVNAVIWVSFTFQFIIFLFSTLACGWTCYIFKCFYCKAHKCICWNKHFPGEITPHYHQPRHHPHHPHHSIPREGEQMMTFIDQQQHQQQQ